MTIPEVLSRILAQPPGNPALGIGGRTLSYGALVTEAGALALMTPEVIATLADHAQGNLRSLMIMADELLVAAAEREAPRIDEELLFEACAFAAKPKNAGAAARRSPGLTSR